MDKIGLYIRVGTENKVFQLVEKIKKSVMKIYGEDALNNIQSYIDIGASSFILHHSLEKIKEDIKTKKINVVFVENMYSFSRNSKSSLDFIEFCLENDTRVYSVDNNNFISKIDLEFAKSITEKYSKTFRTELRHHNFKLAMRGSVVTEFKNDKSKRTQRTVGKVSPYLNVKTEINDYDHNHQNVFWYGGEVANIKVSDGEYKIVARGIVSCDLIAKETFTSIDNDIYEKGDIIASVKDKNEDGLFMKEMSPFIEDDTELTEILNGENDLLELEINNNNWFNLEYYDTNGNVIFDDYILCSNTINDAVDEVKDMIWEKEKESKNYAIYVATNKCPNQNENIKNIIDVCLESLNKNFEDNKDLINIYQDYSCISKPFSKDILFYLINDINKNKINTVLVKNLSMLSNTRYSFDDLIKILNDNKCDIYIVDDNKYLCKDFSKENIILSPSTSLLKEWLNDEKEIEME